MYSTCIFCHRPLGANEVIESFPIGRRLAFDSDRGRLWVVCTRCRQWNLTPLEERWEAIEACERLYRDTRRRVSTENIGLARVTEGLELVRIGKPQRPEFAAWRYGEHLGRRRRMTFLKVGLGLGALGAVVAGGAAVGVGVGGVGYWLYQLGDRIVRGSPHKLIARIPSAEGLVLVKRKHLPRVRIIGTIEERWALALPRKNRLVEISGTDAMQAAGVLLPALNRFGGTKSQVRDAVSLLGEDPDPDRFFRRVVRSGHTNAIADFPEATRLALEMAAHEDAERRAMEGELAGLERAWREAEEIAAISDDMLVPKWVDDRIDKWRR
jgi:hypothetical protein